jgi:hypothetical protein
MSFKCTKQQALRYVRRDILLTLLLLTASASSSSAYPSNCKADLPKEERHYFGGFGNITSIWGATADIETQILDLCGGTPTGGTNLSALWVGIDNGNIGDKGWIQMGYRRLSSWTSNHIYQEARSTETNEYFIWDKAVPINGNTYTYKIDLYWAGTNASSSWNYYLNGELQTNSIPFPKLNISPNIIQVMDEVQNPGNQIGGRVNDQLSWSNIYTKSSKTGAYVYTMLPQDGPDPATFVEESMNSPAHAWTTWDRRYP